MNLRKSDKKNLQNYRAELMEILAQLKKSGNI